MFYKDFKGLKLSALGLGTMRLPVIGDGDAPIDEAAAAGMFDYAMAHGINYYDTAYGYHAGQSETVTGKLLRRYPRESYYLASKFPGYDPANLDKVEPIFGEQLKKCGVDYFDFYLFHNVYEKNIDPYLDEKYGILDYLLRQKAAGRIRHLGFSVHGSYDVLRHFLDAYGSEMEFCQVQLNYLDWTFQNAKGAAELLRERGIPVWIMEPLRGGTLASLAPEDEAKLKALRPEESAPGWALRFAQSVPGVGVTLSGMSNLQQLKENIATYEEEKPLSPREWDALQDIAAGMVRRQGVPCTACRYCTTHCPQELDIPGLLHLYNEFCLTGGGFIAPMAVAAMPEEKRPSACIACGNCETVCPQQLKIPDTLADFTRKLAAVAW